MPIKWAQIFQKLYYSKLEGYIEWGATSFSHGSSVLQKKNLNNLDEEVKKMSIRFAEHTDLSIMPQKKIQMILTG